MGQLAGAVVPRANGIYDVGPVRLIDHSGEKRLPIGWDDFPSALQSSLLVDKTLFIKDVIDSGYKAILFCRPRRFGKTLNMSMLRYFLEKTSEGQEKDREVDAFIGTRIWEVDQGRYQRYRATFPVVYLTFSTAKGSTWAQTYGAICNSLVVEYSRHPDVIKSPNVSPADKALYQRIVSGTASEEDFADSLMALCRMLSATEGLGVVLLIDEYDAPVMAGYTNGYYDAAVNFLRRWLTGAVKSGGSTVAFSCMTGVQRITKESIFSDLNNLVVNTSLSSEFDERFGFTSREVAAIATYMGMSSNENLETARLWYDGYRFGTADIYNPWSILNYFRNGCEPGTYWANTSGNDAVTQAIRHADTHTLERIYELLQPGGSIVASLDLGVVFPDVGTREGALWSMLYLAGYLTTDDTILPHSKRVRRLRIPNGEVRELFENEIVERFQETAGGVDRLFDLQQALIGGKGDAFARALEQILNESASSFDLTSENSVHMLLLGLLYGVPGYKSPISNREYGSGRPDIRLEPDPERSSELLGLHDPRPLITIEVKFLRAKASDTNDAELSDQLDNLADVALEQIAEKGYDRGNLPCGATGRMRWGIAFGQKHVAAKSETLGPQE